MVIKMADLRCDFCSERIQSDHEYISNSHGRCPTSTMTSSLRAKAKKLGWDRVERPGPGIPWDRCPDCKAINRTEPIKS